MLSVSSAVFERHLSALRRHAHPAFLSDLVDGLRSDAPPPRMVALTFDDAYADTLREVEPLLRTYGIPATVFVPTGLLGTEPWWDRLARILCTAGQLPADIVVPAGEGGQFRRALTDGERSSPPGSGVRALLTSEVYDALRSLSQEAQAAFLDALEDEMGASCDTVREVVVSAAEVAELDGSELFEVGSHSVTHPVLTESPMHARRSEVEGSRQTLEALVGRTVDLFSYPNGARDPETDELLREAGYRAGCASQPGVATTDADPFALPRFWPVEDADHVDRLVRHWL
jgi:peptidoglycan/xylan/chitin deacetylase (PgdA/CDA1 family)